MLSCLVFCWCGQRGATRRPIVVGALRRLLSVPRQTQRGVFTATGYKRNWPQRSRLLGVKFHRTEGPARGRDSARVSGFDQPHGPAEALRGDWRVCASLIDRRDKRANSRGRTPGVVLTPHSGPPYFASKSLAFSIASSTGLKAAGVPSSNPTTPSSNF